MASTFIAEAILNNMVLGGYMDIKDIEKNLENDHFIDIVKKYPAKHGIK